LVREIKRLEVVLEMISTVFGRRARRFTCKLAGSRTWL
jgi:hypothetical protein